MVTRGHSVHGVHVHVSGALQTACRVICAQGGGYVETGGGSVRVSGIRAR